MASSACGPVAGRQSVCDPGPVTRHQGMLLLALAAIILTLSAAAVILNIVSAAGHGGSPTPARG